eukprot:5959046-Pyramimonas_sp.AAC.1
MILWIAQLVESIQRCRSPYRFGLCTAERLLLTRPKAQRHPQALNPPWALRRMVYRTSGWELLPVDVHHKVLATLAGAEDVPSVPNSSSERRARCALRLVCKQWRDSHDTLLVQLKVSESTRNDVLHNLLPRFPSLTTLNLVPR